MYILRHSEITVTDWLMSILMNYLTTEREVSSAAVSMSLSFPPSIILTDTTFYS